MCGISGFIDFKNNSNIDILKMMNDSLFHRGPDDNGELVLEYEYFNIGLAHRRLSVLDLTSLGHQPMNYNNFIIVYNGEIYNFKEIRDELILLGHVFSSETDTEVILHSFSEWGEECVKKFIGMFAFSVFDKEKKLIYLFRDRAGVKPLYYYYHDNLFLFSSELKSFNANPYFIKQIDIDAVSLYFDYGYIPSPNCIFKNSYKLNPGHYLVFNLEEYNYEIFKYWDVAEYYKKPKIDISYADAKKLTHDLLISAYEYRMISDVPVGVFLSGGYDSTSVAAILQKNRYCEKIKTFTIGFEDGNNEAPFAKKIANFLGTEHIEYYCTTKDAQNIIPNLAFFYDEPFSDSSSIPTILVSQLAKKYVTVSLSADGGDEIFAGYSIYKNFLKRSKQLNLISPRYRNFTSKVIEYTSKIYPTSNQNFNHKANVLLHVLKNSNQNISSNLYKTYFKLNSHIKNNILLQKDNNLVTAFDNDFSDYSDDLSIALVMDYKAYMTDDILTKVDRATMSVSLEGREPLLDHRLIEFVAQLPNDYKIGSTQKLILKDIVHDYIPKKLMDRPKTGFSIPLKKWLKEDLKYLVEDNLSEDKIKASGIFNTIEITKIKDNFLKYNSNDANLIWKIIQFQLWYFKWFNNKIL
jgi:asparagine synthase (glutamine-hydrolysing)